MVHYDVPFYSNTPDNTHCFQAAIKSVLKYFLPEREFSFEELDQLSNKKEDLWTWSQRAKINMIKMGFVVRDIENWDIDEFVDSGEKYLVKRYGKAVAKEQALHSDLNEARIDYKEYGKYKILEDRIPKIDDIKNLLDDGFLVCCNVNSRVLNKKEGYSGHFVVIIGYGEKYFFMLDPGLPPRENRKVSFNKFKIAWSYPDESAQNITAFKFKS